MRTPRSHQRGGERASHANCIFARTHFLRAARVGGLGPPDGYVESCTVEKQQRAGLSCKLCDSYHGNPADYCAKQAGAGFRQVCRTRGASVWGEVWCTGDAADAGEATGLADAAVAKPSTQTSDPSDAGDDTAVEASTTAAPPAASAPKPSSQGCALTPSGANGALSAAMLLLASLASLLRRRRSR
jgi:hypothetical protein